MSGIVYGRMVSSLASSRIVWSWERVAVRIWADEDIVSAVAWCVDLV